MGPAAILCISGIHAVSRETVIGPAANLVDQVCVSLILMLFRPESKNEVDFQAKRGRIEETSSSSSEEDSDDDDDDDDDEDDEDEDESETEVKLGEPPYLVVSTAAPNFLFTPRRFRKLPIQTF